MQQLQVPSFIALQPTFHMSNILNVLVLQPISDQTGVGLFKSTPSDLDLSSRVKSVVVGATIGLSWRSLFHDKST